MFFKKQGQVIKNHTKIYKMLISIVSMLLKWTSNYGKLLCFMTNSKKYLVPKICQFNIGSIGGLTPLKSHLRNKESNFYFEVGTV